MKTLKYFLGLIGMILLGLILVWILPTTKKTAVKILEENLVAYPNEYLRIDPKISSQTILQQAFRLYEERRYDQALILFDEYLSGKSDEDVLFYRSNTLFSLGQFDLAAQGFKKISAASRYYHPSLWYRALLLLKGGDREAAKKLLENYLSLSTTYKRREAKQLLNRLQS